MISLAEMMTCDKGRERQIEQSEHALLFPDCERAKGELASTSSQTSGKLTTEAKFQVLPGVGQMWSNPIEVNAAFISTFATRSPAMGTLKPPPTSHQSKFRP